MDLSKNSISDLIHDNKYITPILVLFTIVYADLARPQLPKYMEELFENMFFRLVVISFILYKANNDIQTSVLITFCFLFIMHLINNQKIHRCINSNKKHN
jgi:hypothetical protein